MSALLPRLRGRDLTGAARTLPDDLRGRPAVLLLGFAIDHQAGIDRWLEALVDLDVPQLEVPVAEPEQERFARSIEGGMVPGVPVARHDTTVVVYVPIAALLLALGVRAPEPVLVALDGDGRVVRVRTGAPDAEAVDDLARALAPP